MVTHQAPAVDVGRRWEARRGLALFPGLVVVVFDAVFVSRGGGLLVAAALVVVAVVMFSLRPARPETSSKPRRRRLITGRGVGYRGTQELRAPARTATESEPCPEPE
jgi:hypothetical protein